MPGDLPRVADVVSQETAVRAFRAALDAGRLGGAYLLHGPPGVGRSLAARAFACAMLCETPAGGDPCGECRACGWNAAGTHPDFLVVSGQTGPFFKDDAAAAKGGLQHFGRAAAVAAKRGPRRRIPVRTVRRLIDLLAFAPAGGGAKVVVVDAFDDVDEESAATLLKSLEEPPPATTFLVLASGVDAVPETILSRCQRLRFQPLPPDAVRRLMVLHGGDLVASLDEESLARLIDVGQGSVGRALDAARLGVHGDGAAAVRGLVEGDADGEERAVRWVTSPREPAERRERLRFLVALALADLRDRRAAGAAPGELEGLAGPLRGALEAVEANVTPELVVRSLWARAARSR